jgi:PLP dependent protein
MNINNNINYLRQKVPAGCKLIAVSKTQPVETLMEAYAAGQRIFGENKVQEMVGKYQALPKDIEWHMIGHLQSNKVKLIVPFVALIHGVDSEKLLEEINKQAQKNSKVVDVLLQIFIATEETKFGFSEKEVLELMASPRLATYKNIRILGLMGMATFTENQQLVREEFRKLKRFFDTLKDYNLPANMKMQELSMGMSGDYEIAIEEGSTMVRIGTAIFGLRKTLTKE